MEAEIKVKFELMKIIFKEYFSRNAILNDNLTTFPWVTFFDEDRDQ
jgi:hypothetical protein